MTYLLSLIFIFASLTAGVARAGDLPPLINPNINIPLDPLTTAQLDFATFEDAGLLFDAGRGLLSAQLTHLLSSNPLIESAESPLIKSGKIPSDAAFANSLVAQMATILHRDQNTMTVFGHTIQGISVTPITARDFKSAFETAVGGIVDRIVPTLLGHYGIDQTHVQEWTQELKQSFNHCASSASDYKGVDVCFLNFAMSAQNNIGLALTYEISRAKFEKMSSNPNFLSCQASSYEACLGVPHASLQCGPKTFTSPGKDVTNCAMTSVRNGLMEVSGPAITTAVTTQAKAGGDNVITPTQSALIISTAKNSLTACVGKASTNSGFVGCIDQATIQAGTTITNEEVMNQKAVVSSVTSSSARGALAQSSAAKFNSCAELAARDNVRDANGLLNVTACAAEVKGSVTEQVALKIMQKNLDEEYGPTNKDNRSLKQSLFKEGEDTLDKCWPSSGAPEAENACLHKSVLYFAQLIARQKLDGQLPADFKTKNPDFKKQALSKLEKCMSKALPVDLTQGMSGSNSKLDACSYAVVSDSAETIARWEVQNVLNGRVTPAQEQQLISKYVDGQFSDCVGKTPSIPSVSACEVTLEKNIGIQAAQMIIPNQFDAFAEQSGGLAVLGMTADDRTKLLSDLERSNQSCIEQKLDPSHPSASPDGSVSELMDCFKATTHDFTMKIADSEFDKKAGNILKSDPQGLAQQKALMEKNLEDCMDKNPNLNLDAYLDNVKTCASKESIVLVSSVGNVFEQDLDGQINRTIDQYEACEKDRPNASSCDDQLSSSISKILNGTISALKQSGALNQSACSSGASPKDLESFASDMTKATLIASIQDDPEKARTAYQSLFNDFTGYLGGDSATQTKDLSELSDDSALDPVITAAIRNAVSQGFNTLKGDNKLPNAVKAQILDPANFSQIFTPAVMNSLRPQIAGALTAALQGKSVSPSQLKDLQKQVSRVLLNSDRFGSIIASTEIQQQINAKVKSFGPLSFIAKIVAGAQGKCLNWAEVRSTPKGKAAEDCVINEVIAPEINGDTLSAQLLKQNEDSCSQQVNDAVNGGCRQQ